MFYSEMYQAERWHKDERYWPPMYVHEGTGDHIYAGDIVTFRGGELGKIVRFFTVIRVRM